MPSSSPVMPRLCDYQRVVCMACLRHVLVLQYALPCVFQERRQSSAEHRALICYRV